MRTVAEMKDLKPIIKILQDIAAHVFAEGNLRFGSFVDLFHQCINFFCLDVRSTPLLTQCQLLSNMLRPSLLGYHPSLVQNFITRLVIPSFDYFNVLFHFRTKQSPGFQRNVARTHFQLPFQVNFAAQSVEIVPYAHDDFARF